MSDFVHLHTHSEYSMLDGLGRVKDLVAEAKRLGHGALALTDHGVMHGAVEFSRACRAAEIKPIIGVEAYQTVWGRPMNGRDSQFDRENYHLLLLAKSMTGYRNLLKIASNAQTGGYYYKPRVDHDFLAAHAEGIVCTTGCLGAEVPQLLMHGKEKEAYERLGWYVETFGKENFFIELQEHSIPELIPVNKSLVPWAKKFGIGLLATNDVHYVHEEDADPHEMLLCVQTGESIKSEKRMKLSDGSYFLKSRAQMEATFAPLIDLPSSAYDNSVRIAEMCDVDVEDKEYHLPDIDIPEGYNYETYLRHLTEKGLAELYGERASDPEVQARKEHELKIIHQMGFDVYFLIVADLCDFARSRNIWWNVRGSGAGSVVAYTIGITGLDPLKNNLIFERFLNPDRVSMPDFDLDYPDDQREELIRYTIDKYGGDQVAQIVTFGRMKARAAIRDVGRAQEVNLDDVDRIAKLIPAIPGKPVTIQEVMTEGHEFYSQELVDLYKKQPWVSNLLDYSMKLEGVARHSGIHAAAVIVADRELTHYTPLMRASKGSITGAITQYEFPVLESIGLLKVDFLGLSTLSVMREAARLIQERHDVEYTLRNIPFEGEGTENAFKLLSAGEVSGVFQVDGAGMRRVLTEMQPNIFEHIIATISLYRPGPIEYIPNYIRRLHGEEEIDFKHPKLEPILGETLGICVSGDALVTDARTGRRYRLDEVENIDDFVVQGVDEQWRLAAGRVTHWIDSGTKPVFELTLRNGARVKVTADHRLLTEHGWRPLNEINVGEYVATPQHLIGPDDNDGLAIDQRKLRVLAYLIGDGSLASMASVDFVSKDASMLAEYERCLSAFEDVRPVYTEQIRGVMRIGAAKKKELDAHYHAPTSLLGWMRELGFKHAAGSRPGGLRSHEKFVPPLVFELGPSDIAFFLASLWDCDGYVGKELCHYKTISQQLADDVQTLLLRLGIRSTIYAAEYDNVDSQTQRTGYQVTTYETAKLADLLQPHMVSPKREIACTRQSHPTIARAPFIHEVDEVIGLPYRTLMREYGIDRQHFYPKGRERSRISSAVVTPLTEQVALLETARKLNTDWQEVVSIEPVGEERVFDLTVEGLHSFVVNNIVVHNCIYQEQIIQILTNLAGYLPGEADLVRRAISKKKLKDIEKHKKIFIDGCSKNGVDKKSAAAIYADIEFFARYGFNKAHAADYAVITVQTAYLKAKYPVEYMAALLLIERDKTEKVTNFIGECRRMGIDVLAPDINYSGLDFEIQTLPEETESQAKRDPNIGFDFPIPDGSAIRFGMAAIKNVGENPVRAILEGREEGGGFQSLEDMADRVDLRRVGKRPLECLIKAGALDRFGKRSQLLDIIEQLVAQSAGIHSARASGQISMFDALGGAAAVKASPIRLPNIDEAPGREKLQWEKELLGIYVASHPLQQINIDLTGKVTCQCAELSDAHDGNSAVLVGMISDVRQINTKKGDRMAFVQLEDLSGTCDVVIFPRTFEEYGERLEVDSLVLIKGTAQTRQGKTSLLADSIQTHIESAVQKLAISDEYLQYQEPLAGGSWANGPAGKEAGVGFVSPSGQTYVAGETDEEDAVDSSADEDAENEFGEQSPFRNDMPEWMVEKEIERADVVVKGAAASLVADEERAVDEAAEVDAVGKVEPEMKIAPMDDEPQSPVSKEPANESVDDKVVVESKSEQRAEEPPVKEAPVKETPVKETAVEAEHRAPPASTNGHASPNGYRNGQQQNGQQQNGHPHNGQHRNGYSNGSGSMSGQANGSTTRALQITFRRSGNLERDKYRLKEIYDCVCDPKGRDRFVIIIESGTQRTQLAFPNDGCTISERLVGELTRSFKLEVDVEGENG